MRALLLARLTAAVLVLLSSTSLEPVRALRCYCNTERGTAPCVDEVCDAHAGMSDDNLEEDKNLLPFCAGIRHPTRGDFFACALAAQEEVAKRCTAYLDRRENVTIEKCWCNTISMCNVDMFPPIKDDKWDSNEDHYQSTFVETMTFRVDASTVAASTRSTGTTYLSTAGKPETEPTATEAIDQYVANFEPITSGRVETSFSDIRVSDSGETKGSGTSESSSDKSNESLAVATDFEEDYDIREYGEEKAQTSKTDDEISAGHHLLSENTRAETYDDTSSDTPSIFTSPAPEKIAPTTAMTNEIESNVSSPKEYSKPAIPESRDQNDASSRDDQCKGDCKRDKKEDATVYGTANTINGEFLYWVLICLAALRYV